jgi:peptide deformylase
MKLVKYPNFPLLQRCAAWDFAMEAEPFTGLTLNEIAARMFATMYANHGVGLSANQVGLAWRIFVLDLYAGTPQQGRGQQVVINPELTPLTGGEGAEAQPSSADGTVIRREGCLSIDARIKFPVRRHARVAVKAYTLKGKVVEGIAEGYEAQVYQHETDHLNGVCCIDLTDRFSRQIAMKKWRALSRVKQPVNLKAKARRR